MKKFVLILSCLLVLYSSFLDAYAEDDIVDDTQYYGTFCGEEYPIIYSNPNIQPLYDVNGYSVSQYYNNTYFNQSFTSTIGRSYSMTVIISFSDALIRNKTYDIRFSFTSNGNFSGTPRLAFKDLNYDTSFSVLGNLKSTSSNSFVCEFNDVTLSTSSDQQLLYFTLSSNSTSTSLVCTGIRYDEVQKDVTVELGQLSAQMEMLIYLVQNNIVGSLTSILNAWNTYLENFSSWIHVCCTHIRDTLQDMSDRLDSSILGVKSAVTTVGSNIVNSITSMNNNLSSKIETMQNAIVTKLDDTLVVKDKTDINSNNTANDDLKGNITEYDDLESSAVEDFNTSLDDLNTENKLLGDSDFMNSARWVSTQLQNIYDSNIYISYMIDFSLILGIALTIIGIKAKGG